MKITSEKIFLVAASVSLSGCATTGGSADAAHLLTTSYKNATEFEKEAYPENLALLRAKLTSIYNEGQNFWKDYRNLEKNLGRKDAVQVLHRTVTENGFSVYFLLPGSYDSLTQEELKKVYEDSGSRPTQVMKAFVGDPVDWKKVEKIRDDGVPPVL